MQCEECHQHEATVHIQEIIGQKRLALHLCSGCAAEKGISADGDLQGLDIAALLLQLAKEELTGKAAAAGNAPAAPPAVPLHCARCGLTDKEFRKHGRMGCADCYEAFRPLLCPLLAEIQRGTSHVGKHPGATARIPAPAVPPAPAPPPAPPASDLRTLEKSLVRAVTAEDYEKAAALRDEIRRLRAGNPPASGPQDSGSSQVPAAGRETP